MGLFSKLFKGAEVDQVKSDENRKKMRDLFNQAVNDGEAYQLVYGYSEDVSRFNFGLVHGSKSKIGNLIVGWNEQRNTIVVVPTVPDLSAYGEALVYEHDRIHKAYRNTYPSDAFIIYPDSKSYIGINIAEWIDDENVYVYVSQPEEMKQFTEFFKNKFKTK